MGWKDAFNNGNTAHINLNAYNAGSRLKNLGDAFASIGKMISDADAQKEKNRLTDLQIQNEQLRLDAAKVDAAQKQSDAAYTDYAARFDSKKAFGADRMASLNAIEHPSGTISQSDVQNAIDAVNAFYTAPSASAKDKADKQFQTQYDASVQNALYGAKDRKGFNDAFAMIQDGTMNVSPALAKDIYTQLKVLDDKAQSDFNNEFKTKATGYKTFGEFQADPSYAALLQHADATAVEHVIDRFNLNEKQAEELKKTQAEIKHLNNTDANNAAQLQIEREKLNQAKYEWDHPHATKESKGGKDDEKDMIKSIDTSINGLYGKTGPMGELSFDEKVRPTAQWIRTRAIAYLPFGATAAQALTQAQKDFTQQVKVDEHGNLLAKQPPKEKAKPSSQPTKKESWREYDTK